jgi:hypothetical protein
MPKKKDEYLGQGIALVKWKSFPRSIVTCFGTVIFNRTSLIPASREDADKLLSLHGKRMVFPLDEFLGLDSLPFKISTAAMLEIAHWVQLVPSYVEATDQIKKYTPIQASNETIRRVANHVGSLVYEVDRVRADIAWELLQTGRLSFPVTKKEAILYLEADGAMLHTRKKGGVNLDEDSPPDENVSKSNWMENKLAMAFSSDNFVWWRDNKGVWRPRAGKREYMAYLGDVVEFKKHMWALALRNGYGEYQQTNILSDGATWIRNMKEELFPDAQQILDFFHLKENLIKFANDIFDKDEKKYKTWVKNMCDKFKESKWKEVIGEIKQFGKKNLNKSKCNIVQYILNNKNNIDYASYLSKNWFIGSGAIESGNKIVLQQRLKQAGMRWNIESGQYILSLMARSKSRLWDEVINIVRSKYDVCGCAPYLGYPFNFKPEFNPIDPRLQQLKENLLMLR